MSRVSSQGQSASIPSGLQHCTFPGEASSPLDESELLDFQPCSIVQQWLAQSSMGPPSPSNAPGTKTPNSESLLGFEDKLTNLAVSTAADQFPLAGDGAVSAPDLSRSIAMDSYSSFDGHSAPCNGFLSYGHMEYSGYANGLQSASSSEMMATLSSDSNRQERGQSQTTWSSPVAAPMDPNQGHFSDGGFPSNALYSLASVGACPDALTTVSSPELAYMPSASFQSQDHFPTSGAGFGEGVHPNVIRFVY